MDLSLEFLQTCLNLTHGDTGDEAKTHLSEVGVGHQSTDSL